ncbi:MAG: ion channel [bacterium]
MTEGISAGNQCSFVGRSGAPCPDAADGRHGFCFWHDPDASKTGADIKGRLETLAREGRSLEGFVLKAAELRDVNLTFGDKERRVMMCDADLSRANLAEAHFFHIDLRGANLMKANLTQANLNRAGQEDTNLLGAELFTARLEQVDWGRHLSQELRAGEAKREGRMDVAIDLYLEAEEIYRYLTKITEQRGHFNQAGHFYHKEKIMRRMQMRRWSKIWCWSKLVDLLCGYGEAVDRVIIFSLLVMLDWAGIFFFLGVKGPGGPLAFNSGASWGDNLSAFFQCAYFSVVTFTTLGYGDITPTGLTQFFAAAEAFIGAFSMSLFVVVFVRKMIR